MPCILHLIVGGSVRGSEPVLSEEVQPRRRIRIDARALLVYIVERREKCRRDVGEFVDVPLVLYDRVLQCLQDAALRDVGDTARLPDAQGVVRDSVRDVVDRLTHFECHRALALYE